VIINQTQKTILAREYTFVKGFEKIKGLLGENETKTLIFETRFGIHTFLLNSPIDLLILDKNGVVRLTKTVKPNRLAFWNIKYKTVIELPNNTISRTKTKVGDIVKF
jgi:uncharacterized membrane protein (UPF0127 family)